MRIAITASEGSARPTLEMLIAANPPRWTWPSQTPTGMAIAIEISSASTAISRCTPVLSKTSDRLSVIHGKPSITGLMCAPCVPRA